jgi:hypothetical protein
MGRPGLDFPVLPSIPKTGFSCREVKSSGYYADLDTDCQVNERIMLRLLSFFWSLFVSALKQMNGFGIGIYTESCII